MPTPQELRLNMSASLLEVAWTDGSRDAIPFRMLRANCLCAECRSARQRGQTIEASPDIAVSEAVPYGPNAVQLVFSDGHSRGIFPFTYLRELASRATTTADHL